MILSLEEFYYYFLKIKNTYSVEHCTLLNFTNGLEKIYHR